MSGAKSAVYAAAGCVSTQRCTGGESIVAAATPALASVCRKTMANTLRTKPARASASQPATPP
jgi:hypothetical protein